MAKSNDSRSDDKNEPAQAGSGSTKDSRSFTNRNTDDADWNRGGKDKDRRHGGHGRDNQDDRDDDDCRKGHGGNESDRRNHDRPIGGGDTDLLPLSGSIMLASGESVSFTLEEVTVATLNAGPPAITLVKSVDADGDGVFQDSEAVAANTAGQTVDYQYVLTNTSPAGVQDPLTIDSFFDVTLGIDLLNDSVVTLVISGGDADPLLEIGETWTYTVNNVVVPVQNAGTTFINTATVNAIDDEGTPASATDTATVTYGNGDGDPAITVAKTVEPGAVAEGGVGDQTVTYTYVLTNTSAASTDPLTITSLLDDRAGDILDAGIFVGGDTNDNSLLDQGESWTYTIDELVAVGNVGATYSNTVTVLAEDDEETVASDTDTATVTYANVDPAITVVKTVDADGEGFSDSESVGEGTAGQTVDYQYVLTNTSTASTDPLTITSLVDDRGTVAPGDDINVLTAGTRVQTGGDDDELLESGETWTYTVTDVTVPVGNVDDTHINTALVEAFDDEDTVASATDTATVTYTNVDPAITVVKTVDADGEGFSDSESVGEGTAGQTVDYQYVLTNTSTASTDPLTITSLVDDRGTVAPGDDINVLTAGTRVQTSGDDDELLESGETWTYTVTDVTVPVGNVDDTHVNTALVNAIDDEDTVASATDTATVTYTNVDPAITVEKTVAPSAVQEGGVGDQTVTYTYVLTNTSAASTDPLTITSLLDDRAGDILDAGIFVGGDTNDNSLLDQGESWTYTIDELVAVGNVGATYSNTVTVLAEDDEETVASDIDTATVTYANVAPAITVVKTVDADGEGFSDSESVGEGTAGQTVDYQYVLTNTSTASTDPLTITSLVDDRGTVAPEDDINVLTAGTRVQTSGDDDELLESGETWTYTVTDVTVPVGNVDDTHINTALVEAFDDEDTVASATDTATVTYTNVDPAITVVKTVDADGEGFSDSESVGEGTAGQTVDYQYVLTNTSTASTDPLTITSLVDDRGTVAPGDDINVLTAGTRVQTGGDDDELLESGETWTYTVTDVTVPVGNVDDTHINTALVEAFDDEDTVASATDTATVTYTNVDPAITVVKTVDADGEGFSDSESVGEGTAGQTVDYQYVLTNTSTASTDPLTITSLVDDRGTVAPGDDINVLTAGTRVQTGGDDDELLESGETWTYTVTDVTVPVGNVNDTHINTALVEAFDDEDTVASATDTATVTYSNVDPAITVEKTVAPSVVQEGGVGDQTVTYTYVLTNTSAASTDPLTITSLLDDRAGDILDAGIFVGGDTNDNSLLDQGESWTYTIDELVAVGNVGATYSNTVTVLAMDDEESEASDTDTATVTYANVDPAITVVKTVDADGEGFSDSESVGEGTAGQTVDYQYVLTNTSTASTDPLTITSLVDDRGTVAPGDDINVLTAGTRVQTGGDDDELLESGETWTYTVTDVTVPVGNVDDTHINTALVEAFDDEDTVASATDTATITYANVDPAITVAKTVDADGEGNVLTGAGFNESEAVGANGVGDQIVTYRYALTNTSAASTDPLTITSLVDDNGTPGIGGDDVNLLTAAGVTLDRIGGDADTLLESGETWIYTYTKTVPEGEAGDEHVNRVAITVSDDENTVASDTDTATVTYGDNDPAIMIEKTVAPGAVQEGAVGNQTVTYTYVLTNTSDASTDPLTILSLSDDNGTPSDLGDDVDLLTAAGVTLVKTGGDTDPLLESGETWTYTINRTVAVGNVGDEYINTVTVLAADDEETTASATDSATVTYTNVDPAITVEKTVAPSAVQEGGVGDQTVTYTYVLTNTSAASTDPLTITSLLDDRAGDILDAGIFVGGDTNDNSLLDQGESWTYTIDELVAVGNVGATYSNTVTVLAEDDEETVASDIDTATVTYANVDPAITVEKTVAPSAVQEGGVGDQTVTYTYVLTNTSAASTDPLTITSLLDDRAGDILDAGIFVGGDTNDNSLLDQGESWTYTIDELVAVGNVGATYSNTVTVLAMDDEESEASDTDTATVTYTNVDPILTFVKEVDADGDEEFQDSEAVNEGGVGDQLVDYRYTITNTSLASTDPVTIDSFFDSTLGIDLLALSGPIVLAQGASFTFILADQLVPVGNVGDSFLNGARAAGQDDEGNTTGAGDSATVTYVDVTPTLAFVKEVDADGDEEFQDSEAVNEGGVGDQLVDYRYTITNTSLASTDPVTIDSFFDSTLGIDLLALSGPIVLAQGASFSFILADQLVPVGNVGDSFLNGARAAGQDDEGNTTGAGDSATVTYVDVTPTLAFVKEVDADGDEEFQDSEAVNEGGVGDQLVDYRYTITNTSLASTDPVTIDSFFDSTLGIDLLALSGPIVLAQGASFSFILADQLVPVGNVGDSFLNGARAAGQDDEGNTTGAGDSATVTYSDVDPAITVEKTVDADGDGNVLTEAGFNESEAVGANGVGDQIVTYRYALTNTSDASTDPLTITSLSDDNGTPGNGVDDVDLLTTAGVTLHKRGGDADELLESGETWIYTYTKTVPEGNAGDEHVNTVTITASDDEDTEASDTDTATVTYVDDGPVPEVQTKVLHIEKDATVADGIADEVGDIINYTLTVTHDLGAGSNAAIAGVLVSDPFTTNEAPVLVNGFNIGDTDTDNLLDVSESWNYTASHVVTQGDLDTGTPIVNTATATGTNATADTVDAAVPVVQAPALLVQKSNSGVVDGDANGADVGDTIDYSYTVTNDGNVTLYNVSLTDDLLGAIPLSGLTDEDGDTVVDDLAVGAFATGTATEILSQDQIDDGAVTNIAIGTGTPPLGETASDTDTNTVPIPQTPALLVQKSNGGVVDGDENGADAGDTIDYTYNVTNTGNVTLYNVSLADNLLGAISLTGLTDLDSDGQVDDLAVGATATGTATEILSQAQVDAGAVSNTATGTGSDQQGDPASATASNTVLIIGNDAQTRISIAATDAVASEPANHGQFTVTQSAAASVDTVVSYTITGTAANGVDYSTLTGTVTILAGATTTLIDVSVLDEALVEASETVTLTLTAITSGDPEVILGAALSDTVTIVDNDTNTMAIGPVTVNEAAGTMTFTVTQTGSNAVSIGLNYATTDGTAKDGVGESGAGIPDYTASTGTVTFASGTDGTQTFTVPITNDLVVEGSEDFTLTLTLTPQIPSQVSGSSTLVAAGTITDNDSATVSIATITDGAEPSANGLFRVTQSAVSSTDTVVNYSVDGASTATAGNDYTAFSGTVTILAGQTTLDISVPVLDDPIVEGTETVVVNLTTFGAHDPDITFDPTPANLTATVDITDNDTATWSISGDPVAIEGGAASYTVSLAGTLQAGETATINVGLTDVTTTSADYASFAAAVTATIGSRTDLSFVAGTMTYLGDGNPMADLVISLDAVDDEAAEVAEDYQVVLSNPGSSTGANIALGTSAVTTAILDDNERRLTISNVTHTEGTSLDGFTPYVFTVSLAGTPTTTPVTVNVSTADYSGTTAGVDYTAFSNQLVTFAPGVTEQTVTVQVRQDDQQEADEIFQVQLSNPTNATIINNPIFGSGVGVGTITNDDVHTLRISEGVTQAEGTSETGFTPYVFTVSLAGTPTTTPVTVNVSTADYSGTTAGVDYTAFSNQLVTFAPGVTEQTVTVQVRQDDQQEADEIFQVQLSNPTNATIINNPIFGSGVGVGTITNDDVHTLRISEGVTQAEGTSETGFTPYVFTVSLAGTPTTTPVTVNVSTADYSGTTAGVDYQALTNQLLTFAPGVTEQTVTVQVRQDDQQEADEIFQVQLSNPTNATIINNPIFGSGVGVGTITNDDVHTLRISEGVTQAEGTSETGFTPYVFTVSLAGTPTTTPVTVNVSTADYSGTTAGVDYQALTNQLLTFAPGVTEQTVTVQVRQDDQQEADEIFQVQLSNPTNATIINNPIFGSGVGVGTISDDDAQVDVHTLRISEGVTQAEGTSETGFTPYVFTVSLAGTPTTTPVTVNVSTADYSGTTAGVDYQALSNQLLTFAPGVTEQTVTVQVRQDDQQEADEIFQVQLSNPTNATIINNPIFGSGVGVGTITNDDVHTLRISEGVTQAEGTSETGFTPYVFTVSLAGTPTTTPVTVNVSTADYSGTTAGVDYQALTNQLLTFAPGVTEQTVTVQVRQDDQQEADEIFQVQLSNPTNATIINNPIFGSGVGVGTITNDDVHTLRISEGVTQAEGTSETGFTPYVFTVSLAGTPTTTPVTVNVSTADYSGTTAGVDYTAFSNQLVTFAPGVTEQTVTVQVRQDDQQEADEIFQVQLSNPTNATIINNPIFGSGVGVGTITNDDVHTLRISEGVTQAEGTSETGFTPYVFTVSLAGTPTTTPVTVNVSTADYSGTTAGVDYTAFSNQLVTFAPGVTEQTVTVQVRQDDQQEADEYFQVQLSNATNATIAGNVFGNAGIGTILNDDVHTLRISEGVTQAEGTSETGFTPYVFTVSLAGTPTTTPVTVNVSTGDFSGTTAGVDYTAFTNQLVTFAPGETSQTVTVQVRQDILQESDEQFFVNLTQGNNLATIANGFGVGTITNDDAAPPVVLDLDGDGLEFVPMGDASNQAQFDFDGDGTKETAAWVGSGDGFLAYDANGDRRVNDGSEIAFADMTAEVDSDLEALKAVFDSNHDGLLTEADEQFSSFGVWRDANGNGATEADEFKTLEEAGIVSLGLTSDGVSYNAANGQVTVHGEASFMYQDGSQGLLGDVSLAIGGPADSSVDSLSDGAGINQFDLVLSRQANGLRNALQGSSDQVTGQNWYGGAGKQVETIQTCNGQTLLSSQVNQLIEAMAGFSSDNGMTCDQGVAAKPEEVQAVIAASWQS